MDKKELRRQIRSLKKNYTPEQLKEQSEMIMKQLEAYPPFRKAQTVMLYAALPDEVQTAPFIEAWRHTKKIVLPTVEGDDIVPVELTDNCGMKEGDFHIMEPENVPYKGTFDLIVVPGMAFDEEGHRLGRGKGYYDRFLAKHPDVATVGICFGFQFLESIPTEPHDRNMDRVLTGQSELLVP
jgi:5-formyltetrahydrofolate cyclo-ligase